MRLLNRWFGLLLLLSSALFIQPLLFKPHLLLPLLLAEVGFVVGWFAEVRLLLALLCLLVASPLHLLLLGLLHLSALFQLLHLHNLHKLLLLANKLRVVELLDDLVLWRLTSPFPLLHLHQHPHRLLFLFLQVALLQQVLLP